jgi:hypothetical protein
MKKIKLLLLSLAIVLFSCEKEEEVLLSSLNVTVEMSADYSEIPVSGIYVKILNTADNYEDSIMTDAVGNAFFDNLPPGIYNVSASLELTEEQVFNSTGYNQSITLNAVSDGVSPLPGQTSNVSLVMDGKPSGSLLIKQFYYPAGNVPTLPLLFFKDQFIEIYNNSDEVINADGLYIAALAPNAPGFDNDKVTTLPIDEFVYTEKVIQVPGDGDEYPIQPGESIKVAMNGIDFTEGGTYSGTVDNSDSDFEVNEVPWLQERGLTPNTFFIAPDNPDVQDVNITYMRPENGVYFYFNSNGASVVITMDEPDFENPVYDPDYPSTPLFKISTSSIIDGIDFLAKESAVDFKRLPTSIDASFGYLPGGSSRSGKTAVRKVAKTIDGREVLMDTNNTANDFEFKDIE